MSFDNLSFSADNVSYDFSCFSNFAFKFATSFSNCFTRSSAFPPTFFNLAISSNNSLIFCFFFAISFVCVSIVAFDVFNSPFAVDKLYSAFFNFCSKSYLSLDNLSFSADNVAIFFVCVSIVAFDVFNSPFAVDKLYSTFFNFCSKSYLSFVNLSFSDDNVCAFAFKASYNLTCFCNAFSFSFTKPFAASILYCACFLSSFNFLTSFFKFSIVVFNSFSDACNVLICAFNFLISSSRLFTSFCN